VKVSYSHTGGGSGGFGLPGISQGFTTPLNQAFLGPLYVVKHFAHIFYRQLGGMPIAASLTPVRCSLNVVVEGCKSPDQCFVVFAHAALSLALMVGGFKVGNKAFGICRSLTLIRGPKPPLFGCLFFLSGGLLNPHHSDGGLVDLGGCFCFAVGLHHPNDAEQFGVCGDEVGSHLVYSVALLMAQLCLRYIPRPFDFFYRLRLADTHHHTPALCHIAPGQRDRAELAVVKA
jgi:hypothetical protein